MAAKLRDKVWVCHAGKKYRADVSRVSDGKNGLAPDEVDANYHETTEPDEAGIVHNQVVGGLTALKLAQTEADKSVDGHWWPRSGNWVTDPTHGRKAWQGE